MISIIRTCRNVRGSAESLADRWPPGSEDSPPRSYPRTEHRDPQERDRHCGRSNTLHGGEDRQQEDQRGHRYDDQHRGHHRSRTARESGRRGAGTSAAATAATRAPTDQSHHARRHLSGSSSVPHAAIWQATPVSINSGCNGTQALATTITANPAAPRNTQPPDLMAPFLPAPPSLRPSRRLPREMGRVAVAKPRMAADRVGIYRTRGVNTRICDECMFPLPMTVKP